jgi:catecholate siderophore receptor
MAAVLSRLSLNIVEARATGGGADTTHKRRAAAREVPIMRLALIPFLAVALAVAHPTPISARPVQAAAPEAPSITGTVLDSTGGAVPAALVTLVTAAGERQTTTDTSGRFIFEQVPAGPGTVTVTLDRFSPVTVDIGIRRTELRIILEPVPLSEEVTVRGSALNVPRITSGTKTDTPLRDVPQAITVITKEFVADQRMQGMADVLRYIPGVGIAQGEGNRDTAILRGNSSTSDFFFDGVRDDVQYFRDLYNVERIEAFKGANAMIFGRGGVGGVINRVGKQAEWMPTREVSIQAGSFENRRLAADLGQAMNDTTAFRVNGVYENSDSYRDGYNLERYGANPTLAFQIGQATTLRAGYEHFHDERTVDRGIPSFQGRPLETDESTFFGNPEVSTSDVTVNAFTAVIEHEFDSRTSLRSRLLYGNYDKFYQNVFPGAVNAAGTQVSISGYNNGTDRTNLFSQTDVVARRRLGRTEHTFLAGVELGRQETDNLRLTAFFTTISPTTTSVSVPVTDPVTELPVDFRPNPTDADNDGVATVAAAYLQDQIAFTNALHAVIGIRLDHFNVDFTNNRTASNFESTDNLVAPRVGFIYKPAEPVSLYASYSLSYLPRAGEQLSSLSLTNQALDPEEFRNYEIGAKADLASGLQFTAAVYRLDRGNVIVADPVDPSVSLLVDAQRTRGLELGLSGNVTQAWSLAGGYAYQDGEITRALSATVPAGSKLAQLPEHSFSLWNKYELNSVWAVGLGIIHRGEVFTSTDNLVILPSFTRVDAAVFCTPHQKIRVQVNVQNLFDEKYYPFAHNNNNITPGSPRAALVALTTHF